MLHYLSCVFIGILAHVQDWPYLTYFFSFYNYRLRPPLRLCTLLCPRATAPVLRGDEKSCYQSVISAV